MGRHTWRLVADDENFDVAEVLSEIVETTETEPIDHWFAGHKSIFMGRGEIPQHRHIAERPCDRCCDQSFARCSWCCGNGFVLTWTAPADFQVAEAIQGLREMIREWEEPFDVRRAA